MKAKSDTDNPYPPGLLMKTKPAEETGRLAQLVERRPYKPDATGSSPVPPTINKTSGLDSNIQPVFVW